MPTAFKILKLPKQAAEAIMAGLKEGDVVFQCIRYDYGCANDDTRMLGIKHISLTLKRDGDYPFFTCPVTDLEEISS